MALRSLWAAARRVLQKNLARHDCVCIFYGRWFCSSRWDGGCCAVAAALGALHRRRSAVGRLARHATNSPTLRCVLFVIEAVCSMACSVLTRFTMFCFFFSRIIPGAVCFSLFHCKAMTLLAIHCWSALIFLLPRFILRAAARHRSSFELLVQHIS